MYVDRSDAAKQPVFTSCRIRPGSSVGLSEFEPYIQHILSWIFRHENTSTVILTLSLFQVQLPATVEMSVTNY